MISYVLLKKCSPTPLNNIVLLLEVRIKSMSEGVFRVMCWFINNLFNVKLLTYISYFSA